MKIPKGVFLHLTCTGYCVHPINKDVKIQNFVFHFTKRHNRAHSVSFFFFFSMVKCYSYIIWSSQSQFTCITMTHAFWSPSAQ